MGIPTRDLNGLVFGDLEIVRRNGKDSGGNVLWLCKCSCGNLDSFRGSHLYSGAVERCRRCKGKATRKHGDASYTQAAEYHVWEAMIGRCTNPRHQSFVYYGARGISVCQRWMEYANFISDMGRRPTPKHTLDRIDNNNGYEPSNCRWALWKEQLRNTRRNRMIAFRGKTQCLSAWAEEVGLSASVIRKRIDSNWPLEEAMCAKAGCVKGQPRC